MIALYEQTIDQLLPELKALDAAGPAITHLMRLLEEEVRDRENPFHQA